MNELESEPGLEPGEPSTPPPRRFVDRLNHFAGRILKLGLFGLLPLVILGYVVFEWLLPYQRLADGYDLNNLNDLPISTTLYDRNDAILSRLYTENRTLLKPNEIPERIREAFVAAEDRRFYEHGGLDLRGIARAALVNLKSGKIAQGGSTITQQLAKHIIGDTRRTWDRKLREAFVTRRLEKTFSKDELLTYYLNRVYFGSGYFGLAAAAEGYFGKKPRELTVAETALLAGLVRAPSSYSPRQFYEVSIERSHIVLRTMEELGFISSADYETALKARPPIVQSRPGGAYSHYLARIISETEQILELSHREQAPQGLKIHTTLLPMLQKRAEQLVAEEADRAGVGRKRGDDVEAGAIVMESATGQILAYVGGRDFSRSQYDHVAQARRQGRDLLLPWIAGLGIEDLGLTPASLLDSSYFSEADLLSGMKPPALLETKPDRSSILLQDALVYGNDSSLRRVAASLPAGQLEKLVVGGGLLLPEETEGKAAAAWPSFTLLNMTALYAALGEEGRVPVPYLIRKIETASGEVLYENPAHRSEPLLDPVPLAQVRHALTAKAEQGSGRLAQRDASVEIERALFHAASPGLLDSSCIGVTPDLAVGVWLGSTGNTPFPSREEAEGASIPLWTHVVDAASVEFGRQGTFLQPRGMTEVEVDRRTGVVQGFTYLGTSPGNAQVLLDETQMDALTKIKQSDPGYSQRPASWAQWFGNILAAREEPEGGDTTAPGPGVEFIPENIEFIVPAVRGDILTRDGEKLATSVKQQTLVCSWPSPREALGDEAVVAAVRSRIAEAEKVMGIKVALSDFDIVERYRFKRFLPLELDPDLSPVEVDKFLASSLEQRGLALQGYPERTYPHGTMLAHSLGYLRKTQSANAGRYMAGEVIHDLYAGSTALESLYDTELRGSDGVMRITTRDDGFLNQVEMSRASKPGLNVRLAIDGKWQAAVEQVIQGKFPACALVMDVRNGDILAMASYPTFNPNDFTPRMSAEAWKQLSDNPDQPMLNRAYRQHYPPGSVFKIVTTIAAMQAGTFDPNRTVTCTGTYTVGNVVYHIPREKGVVNFKSAMAKSYNTYFFDMALRTPRDALVAAGKESGFGQATGFGLPYEEPGTMPDPEFVKQNHQRIMGPGDVTNTSIGQGDVLATPLQLARFMTAVANRGTFYRPRLVTAIEDASGKPFKTIETEEQGKIVLNDEQWDEIHESLRSVVTEGTAPALNIPDLPVAAKTGTAQITSGETKRQIAWVAGFAPADRPRFAFVFMIEGQFGDEVSSTANAVPVARKAIEAFLGKKSEETAKVEH